MIDEIPPPEYERELRELYHERNARSFATPKPEAKPLPRQHIGELVIVLVVATVVGLIGGTIAATLLQPPVPPLVVERSTRSNIGTIEVGDEVASRLLSSTAALFVARATKGGPLLDQVYLVREAVGQAVVLSSDGWLATTQAVINDPRRSYLATTADGKLHPVTMVVTDPVAPLVYLKIEASNLTVTPFVDFTSLQVGQPVAAAALVSQSSARGLYVRRLSSLQARLIQGRGDLPVSSESLPDRYLLDEALPAGSLGAPVSTLRGEVVGLVADYGGAARAIVPLDSLALVMEGLFSKQELQRPSLGIFYLDASWVAPFLPIGQATFSEGALATPSGKQPAVAPRSPAANAGLKEGDVVVALGGERLGRRSLSSLLQQYRPGARVELTVERLNKEVKLVATLGEVVARAVPAPVAAVEQPKVK